MDGDDMKTQEAVRERISDLIKEKDFTINGLAYHAGMPKTTLKNILLGVSKNPGIVTIKIICDGLGITLNEFFDCEYFHNLNQEIE